MDAALIEKVECNHLLLEQGHHLAMSQGTDQLQILFVLQGLRSTLRDHPTITDEDDFLDPVVPFDFLNLVDHRGLVFGIACIDFHPNRAALSVTDEPDDNLLASLLAVSVVAEGHQLARLILPFKINAGDVIEDQLASVEMAAGQVLLNRPLALQELIHGLITVHIHIRWTLHTTELPQAGIGMVVAQGELTAGIDKASDDHRQRTAHPGLRARIERPVQADLLCYRQDRMTGAILPAVENLERSRIINGNDTLTESQLKECELLQRAAGDTPVLGMLHLAVLAKGGAQNTHRAFTGGLYFQMQIAMRRVHG